MRKILILLLLILTAPTQAETCTPEQDLKNRAVQILREGRGVGTGVLLNNTHILTAEHVLKRQPRDRIWVRTPHNVHHLIRASVVASSHTADMTLLALHPAANEVLPQLAPLPISTLNKNEPVRHVGYAFGQLHRLGVLSGTYKGQQQTSHQQDIASHITLNAPAYGGDSGGPLFNCQGALVGLEFGNRAHEGLPHEAYFITPQSIQTLLGGVK